jgi:hypothetical protein
MCCPLWSCHILSACSFSHLVLFRLPVSSLLVVLLSFALSCAAQSSRLTLSAAQRVAALIDPAKLATLAERGANPRVQKYVAQLEEARLLGHDPRQVAMEAVSLVGMKGDAAALTVEAMLRNLTIAERLGCLNPAGLHDMRRGQSPTIMLGPNAGDQLSVDHIIPFSVAPSLDKVIANLELMPFKLNLRKKDYYGQRQRALAERLRSVGFY